MGVGFGKSVAKGLKSFIENISESEYDDDEYSCDEYDIDEEEESRLREDRLTPYMTERELKDYNSDLKLYYDNSDEIEELSKFGLPDISHLPKYEGEFLRTLSDFKEAYTKIYTGDFEFSRSDLDSILDYKFSTGELSYKEYINITDNYTT